MPKLTGIEVLRQVTHAQDLPICVLTGSEEERDLFQQEFNIQDSNYLLKPVTQDSLLGSSCCREHLKPETRP